MENIKRTKFNTNKNCSEKVHSLDINIPNLILTPLTCASLIGEILKCLIFEKSLIPYPYHWLKNVVGEHRKENNKINVERKQKVAAAAFDATENIINNIKKLFKLGNNITEFLILIGATPLNPKEVYRINIPKIAKGHHECNHYGMITKYQPKFLRSLLLSAEWMIKMEQTIPITNLYSFVKIANGTSFLIDSITVDNFVPSSSFFVPKSAHSLTINLLFDDRIFHNCCASLSVYEEKCIADIMEEEIKDDSRKDTDICEEEIKEDSGKDTNKCEEIEDDSRKDTNKSDELLELNVEWLQSNSILRGFK